ncbi:MAG: MBOAT family protein [Clostridiales bacterium]|jgi:D-alanyl-lipoteichoic acid acyltransferase DltB (MBOAT superfamily)|nr:MBOAT family protein [Clostridiales bacterium]
MLFTSLPFIVFVTVLLILYYLLPLRFRWGVLLAGSLFFYAQAGLSSLLYVAATVCTTYAAGLAMFKARFIRDEKISAASSKEEKKAVRARAKSLCFKWLLACLIVNFGILAVIKYTGFLLENLGILSAANGGVFTGFVVPLGISFYTFQTMGYIIDVYREKAKPETNILKLALFASFFPQVIQGPISRFNDLSLTLLSGNIFHKKNLSFGAQRVLWGFFKKLVIADRLAAAMNALFTGEYAGVYALLAMLLYAVVLYADFSGGIDITVGVAEMFGVKVAENFDRPFYAPNIAEYWRRWHISMGSWFRDYLFYPLSVCKPMLKLSAAARKKLGDTLGKRVTVYISLFTVWFMTGLWHGATWNFIVWGLVNGLFLLLTQEFQPLYDKFRQKCRWSNSKGYAAFQIVRTFLLMCAIRSIDRYNGVGTAFRRILSVFTEFNFTALLNEGVTELGVTASGYIAAGLGLAVVLWVSFLQRNGKDIREILAGKSWALRSAALMGIFFMIVIFGAYGLGYDARQFMYNQF